MVLMGVQLGVSGCIAGCFRSIGRKSVRPAPDGGHTNKMLRFCLDDHELSQFVTGMLHLSSCVRWRMISEVHVCLLLHKPEEP